MKVGHLRVIFKLPETVGPLQHAVPSWPKEHLAFVEWYKLSGRPGPHHNMYTVTSPYSAQTTGRPESRHSRLF